MFSRNINVSPTSDGPQSTNRRQNKRRKKKQQVKKAFHSFKSTHPSNFNNKMKKKKTHSKLRKLSFDTFSVGSNRSLNSIKQRKGSVLSNRPKRSDSLRSFSVADTKRILPDYVKNNNPKTPDSEKSSSTNFLPQVFRRKLSITTPKKFNSFASGRGRGTSITNLFKPQSPQSPSSKSDVASEYTYKGKESKWTNTFRMFSPNADLFIDKVLFSSLTDHRPCKKCSKLIKQPKLASLFGANEIHAVNLSGTAMLKGSAARTNGIKINGGKEKRVEIELFNGKLEVYSDDIMFLVFHVYDVYQIELAPDVKKTLILHAFVKSLGTAEESYRREVFFFTFDSEEEAKSWTEYILLSLFATLNIVEETLKSLDNLFPDANMGHTQCLLRKKARLLELCLPRDHKNIIEGYKDIVAHLMDTGNADDAGGVFDRVQQLAAANKKGRTYLDEIKLAVYLRHVSV
eukprot:snap_masked-scaffold_19-processed-gene-6.43-mRNA-1 protein AED:1.00 eAED:1.00 QI:0/-1/0/0/-1/1/1/0/457